MFDQDKCQKRVDKSKKGRVDRQIASLVRIINSLSDYYTTSSCAGRIVLLEKVARKCDNRMLLVSHKPVSQRSVTKTLKKIGEFPIWLKQEPVIVHVCCKTMEAAERLLKCAQNAGLKHSGIVSLRKRLMLEIIGTEQMEAIVAQKGKVLTTEDYLKILVSAANEKLRRNHGRVKKFEQYVRSTLLNVQLD